MKTVDVGAVIDDGRWTGYKKLMIVGTALTIIIDGVDNRADIAAYVHASLFGIGAAASD